MYLPPKTYEKKAYRLGAVRMARNWLTRDITPEGMVIFFSDIYKKCGNDAEEQRKLLALIAYCMSLADENFAIRAAKMAGIDWTPGRSVGESIAIFLEEEYGDIPWRAAVGEGFGFEYNLRNFHPDADIDTYASPKVQSFIAYLTEVDGSRVYAWRSPDGELIIDVVNHFDEDILIDEEMFNDEPPLYFSEHSHFISPVCVANVTRRVLESVLEIIGYPPVSIRTHIYFTHPDADFVNAEDYSDGNRKTGWRWNGVDVHTTPSFRTPVVTNAVPFVTGGLSADSPLGRNDAMLFKAVGATAFMQRTLKNSEWLEHTFDTKRVKSFLRKHNLI